MKSHMKCCNGAALTETFVLMFVLIPIMLGIPMIGKLIDLRQTTVQASRYAAWETTVNQTGIPPDNLKARFFSDSNVALGGDASAPHALWGGNRDGEAETPLEELTYKTIMSPDHTAVRLDETTGAALPYSSAYDHGADEGAALLVQEMIEETGNAAVDLVHGEWMDSGSIKGMVRSEVRADVKGNGLFETLSFDDATVIMYDNWSSADDKEAKKRVRALVPTGALEPIGNGIALLGEFPLLKELKDLGDSDEGGFGYVDMEPLPAGESPFVDGARIERVELQPYEGD